MPFPSQVLAAGNSPLSTTAISGTGATGLVAVGTNLATGLQLSATWNTITTSAGSTGVILPPCEAGMVIGIRNDSGQTIAVYCKTGTTINAAAASVTLATALTMLIFATSATTFASITSA